MDSIRRSLSRRVVGTLAALTCLSAGRSAAACAPAPVDVTGQPPLSQERAIALLKSEEGVDVVEESRARCPGGGPSYGVSFGGEPMGGVDAPAGENRGAILLAVVREMLKTPKRRLKALVRAHEILRADMALFKRTFGVGFSFQNALPLRVRYPDLRVQRLSAFAEECSVKGYSNSSVELGKVEVDVSEYLFGRSDYPPTAVYKRGDLGKAFSKAGNGELFRAYLKRVELNAKNCESDPSAMTDWKAMLSKVTKPASPSD